MRILIDARTINDHFPGIGRYAYHLARALARQRDCDSLLLISNPTSANTRLDVAALASEPNVRIVQTAARPFTAREQLHLPIELRKLSPQVSHFPYPIMPYASPRPVVLTIHDIIPTYLPQYFSFRQRILLRISLLLALRSAAFIICVSEATRSDLQSAFRVDSSRLFVVHEGVAESFRPRTRDEVLRVRTAHGLPEQYLLYVGSNKPHKNLPALIDAYARLRDAPPLILAGTEDPRYWEARHLVELLKLRDRVRFLGAIAEEDLPVLYSGALAFVFPSMYEGFGLPPLEAMACGVPVACSQIPSLRETLGDAALLFDAKDPASIAAALERVIRDEELRTDLQSRGLRRAAELTWDLAAKKTMDIYRLAANSK
jgi:glycosyltransferase involved in cell wall biosynthesis